MEKSQAFRCNLSGEKIDAGCVAARPGKAGDQTKPDWVVPHAEDDRDRCGRRLGRLGTSGLAGRSYNGDATADEASHERRREIVTAVQPMVLARHGLALEVAGFADAFAETHPVTSAGRRLPTHNAAAIWTD